MFRLSFRSSTRRAPQWPRLAAIAAALTVAAATSARAQDADDDRAAQPNEAHMFGVIPNHATVEKDTPVDPLTAGQKFKLVSLDTFDPFVYPYVGIVAEIERQYGRGTAGYLKQYAAAFADNTIGDYMTGAVMPAMFHQDPRYFELGSGPFGHRAVYAASRTIVTRGDSGRNQFNLSEFAGNAAAAVISNAYYPAARRTMGATFTRMGSQMAFDGLANELKEFWPDLRRKVHRGGP